MKNKTWLFRLNVLPPAVLLCLLVFTLLIIVLSLFYEYRARQRDYISLLEKQASLLNESLSGTTRQALASAKELEQVLNEQAYTILRIADAFDAEGKLTEGVLDALIATGSVNALLLYDENGILKSGRADVDFPGYTLSEAWVRYYLKNIRQDTVISLSNSYLDENSQLAAVISGTHGGLLCAMIGSESIRQARKQAGPGHFLKQFQSNPSVEYVVIQNAYTILAGYFEGHVLSSFDEDVLLQRVSEKGVSQSRVIQSETQIFETITPMIVDEQNIGVLRIGLAMDEFMQLKKDMNRRLWALLAVLMISALLFLNVLLNIQLRQRAQQEFHSLSLYAETVLQNLMSGVLSVDEQYRIQSLNRKGTALLDVDKNVIGKSLFSVFTGDIAAALKQGIENTNHEQTDFEIAGESGTKRSLQIRANVCRIDNETLYVFLIDDITHQKQLETETRRNQRLMAMRDLAASVAHEIKNPLNGIHLLVQLIRRQCDEFPETHSRFQTIESEIHRISTIVDDYLRWARPLKPRLRVVSVRTLVMDVLRVFEKTLQAKNIVANVMVNEADLKADADQLKQVLINLIKNAEEAIGESGTINIQGRQQGAVYLLKIADSGEGIAEAVLPRIFDFYYSTKKEGSGIGLPVVQQIVLAHQGRVDVSSQSGQGTVFTIQLPLDNTD